MIRVHQTMVCATCWSLSRSVCTMVEHGLRQLSGKCVYSGDPTGPPAFVFDIDGVLIRGSNVLPAAVQAMKQLCPHGVWRFPVCFLTNGGGVSEAKKAQQLSCWLGVPVLEHQVILSHTPMRSLAQGRLGQVPVLVCGRGEVLSVAAGYGFSKVMHTTQLAAASPGALPFQHIGEHDTGVAGNSGAPCPVRDLGWSTESHPLAAVLVMADPAGQHWYQDLQLLTDVITSHGVPARPGPAPGSQPVELYFSNPDLLWAAEYSRARFGQGAFSTALDALHRQITGTPVPAARWFGKPNPEPYRLAEQLLAQQAVQLGLIDAAAVQAQPPTAAAQVAHRAAAVVAQTQACKRERVAGSSAEDARRRERQQQDMQQEGRPLQQQQHTPHQWQQQQDSQSPGRVFSAIFAIGDNPAADVCGANLAGPPWVSVLVRTGVFREGGNSCSDPAHVVVSDVLAAVQAGLHRARSSRWHSMR